MKCATSSHSSPSENGNEEEGTLNDEPHLVEFPLHSEESLLDLIISQCCKLQFQYQGKNENNIAILTAPDPPIINEHWSHKEHPLVQFQFRTSENDNKLLKITICATAAPPSPHPRVSPSLPPPIRHVAYPVRIPPHPAAPPHPQVSPTQFFTQMKYPCFLDYNRRELICDGCIQPITIFHPSYYACMKCGFFLHSFCATNLPRVLVARACPPHPQHSLLLSQKLNFYTFARCEICCYETNGFFYHCKTCNITIDIRCAFLPTKITHKSHKHHSLVYRPSFKFECSVSGYTIGGGVQYGCGTCGNFQIDIDSAFYPGSMKHRYDDHPVTLRRPPFFYEGVFYCEICEDQVNNQWWLYHCDECDHSFHNDCLLSGGSVKLGRTVEVDINDQSHTLALVLKRRTRKTQSEYFCRYCGNGYKWNHFLECDGCGYLICCPCVSQIKASNKSIHF